MGKKYLGYVINARDNVGIALRPLEVGRIVLSGAFRDREIDISEPIPEGHKFALQDIKQGEKIIKFGGIIGTSKENILKGSYVHLHNMKSDFDEYAATLDVETALDHQIVYTLEQEVKNDEK